MRKRQVLLLGSGILFLGGLIYIGDLIANLISEPPPLPKVKPTLTTIEPASPLDRDCNGNVQGGRLLHRVEPVYPATVREKHWRPLLFTIETTVDEKGNVEDVQMLSGDPACNDAALQAVRRWNVTVRQ